MTFDIELVPYVNDKSLLPGNDGLYHREHNIISNKFCGSDSIELFNENLKKQPNNWHYRTKEITYNINSNGYRTLEWDQISWEESILVFGCSHVFGVGLAEDETISSQLSLLCNRPVINLGVSASSNMFIHHNSILTIKNFPTPWAVVCVWTGIARVLQYATHTVMNLGTWRGEHDLFKAWVKNKNNPVMHNYFDMLSTRELWRNRTRFTEISFFDDVAALAKCTYVKNTFSARDFIHPGADAMKIAAISVAQNIM